MEEYSICKSYLESNVKTPHESMEFISDYEKYFGMAVEGDITSYEDIKYSYLFRYEIFSEFILFLYLFFWCIMIRMTVLFSKMNIKTDLKKIGVLKVIGFTN